MLTVVVLAKNEAENLPRCLESLQFCDQILVIDDKSTDNTQDIARKFGAKVHTHDLDGDYSKQRNWALEQAKTPWVLFVDADEVVSSQLASEIKAAIQKIEYKGYLIPRRDYIWGCELKYGDVSGVNLVRLGRRGSGSWAKRVHENWEIEGRVGKLKHSLAHYPHPTVVEFLQHINAYSTIRAHEFKHQGRGTNALEIVGGPPFRFLTNYVLRLGFLDGTAGFVHAMTMAFYTFLTLGKLWLLGKGIDEHKWVTSV